MKGFLCLLGVLNADVSNPDVPEWSVWAGVTGKIPSSLIVTTLVSVKPRW